MSSGFPSFSHFFSQDDVSEQHEAEGALSDGEETHQRLLGHLDKFKHRPKDKKSRSSRTSRIAPDSPIHNIDDDSADEIQHTLAPPRSNASSFAPGLLEKMAKGAAPEQFYGKNQRPTPIVPGASIEDHNSSRAPPRNSALRGPYQPGQSTGGGPNAKTRKGKQKEEEAYPFSKPVPTKLPSFKRSSQSAQSAQADEYSILKSGARQSQASSSSGMGANGLELPRNAMPHNFRQPDINLLHAQPSQEAYPSRPLQQPVKKKENGRKQKKPKKTTSADLPPVVHNLVSESDEEDNDKFARDRDPTHADPIEDPDGFTVSDNELPQPSTSRYDESTDPLDSIPPDNTKIKRSRYEGDSVKPVSRISQMKPKNKAPDLAQFPPPARPGVHTEKPFVHDSKKSFSFPVKRAHLGLLPTEQVYEFVCGPGHFAVRFKNKTPDIKVSYGDIQAVKLPFASAKKAFPPFFALSIKMKGSHPAIQRGVFEPGTSANGFTSWILLQFDTADTEYEYRNLGILVSRFSVGHEKSIDRTSLDDTAWTSHIGMLEWDIRATGNESQASTRSAKAQQVESSRAAEPSKRPKAKPSTRIDGTNSQLSFNKSSTSKVQPSNGVITRTRTAGNTLSGKVVSYEEVDEDEDVDMFSSRKRKAEEELAPIPRDEFSDMKQDEVILVYPFEGTGGISITVADIRRLGTDDFLNDTLIEFGLRRIQDNLKASDPDKAEAVHMFNSFFYKRFTQKSKSKDRKQPVDNYLPVSKWTAKIDFFKKDYIVVPINENLHWYLAIICNPGRILELPEGDASERRQSNRLADKPAPVQAEQSTSRQDPSALMEVDQPDATSAIPAIPSKSNADAATESRTASESSPAVEMASRRTSASPEAQASQPVSRSGSPDEDMDRDPPEQSEKLNRERDSSTDTEIEELEEGAKVQEPPLFNPPTADFFSAMNNVSPALPASAPVNADADTVMAEPEADQAPASMAQRPPTQVHPGAAVMDAVTDAVVDSDDELDYINPSVLPRGAVDAEANAPQVKATDAESKAAAPTEMKPGAERCHILTFDSLGSSHAAVITKLRLYMSREAENKKKKDIRPKTIEQSTVGSLCSCPIQEGFTDCGVFLLHFVEKFLQDPSLAIAHAGTKPPKIPGKNKATPKKEHVIESWKSGNIPARRGQMREDIRALSKEWKVIKAKRDAEEKLAKEARKAEKERLRAEAALAEGTPPAADIPVASTSTLPETKSAPAPVVSKAQPAAMSNKRRKRDATPPPIYELSDDDTQSPAKPSAPKSGPALQTLSAPINPEAFGTGKQQKKDKQRSQPEASNLPSVPPSVALQTAQPTTSHHYSSKLNEPSSVGQPVASGSTRDSGVHADSKFSSVRPPKKKSPKRTIPQNEDEPVEETTEPASDRKSGSSLKGQNLPGSCPNEAFAVEEDDDADAEGEEENPEEQPPPSAQPAKASSPVRQKSSSPVRETLSQTEVGAYGRLHTRFQHPSRQPRVDSSPLAATIPSSQATTHSPVRPSVDAFDQL